MGPPMSKFFKELDTHESVGLNRHGEGNHTVVSEHPNNDLKALVTLQKYPSQCENPMTMAWKLS